MTTPAAVTAAGSAQASQAGLALVTGQLIRQVFGQLDVTNLNESLPSWKQLYAALIRRHAAAAATLAARQYQAARLDAGVRGGFTVKPAAAPPLVQISGTVDWAVQPLQADQPDLVTAERRLEVAGERLVLDSGRQTIVVNVNRDRKARGWARVTEPAPCAFCAMLATRGMAYRSEQSADFRTHDHCRCHAEPVFTQYEPPAQVREWGSLYSEATAGVSGMQAKQTAWRKAFTAAYSAPQ